VHGKLGTKSDPGRGRARDKNKKMNQNLSERVRTGLTFAWQSVTVSSFHNCRPAAAVRPPPFWLGLGACAWAGAATVASVGTPRPAALLAAARLGAWPGAPSSPSLGFLGRLLVWAGRRGRACLPLPACCVHAVRAVLPRS
jgi:hypothetical protein